MPVPEAISIDNNPSPQVIESTTGNEGIDNPSPPNMAEAVEGYSYTRADGTVEHALSPADAIRRCPVLGRMTLEQANVLLEIAALGEEKLKQSTPQNNVEAETKKEENHLTPTPKKEEAVHIEEPINKTHAEIHSVAIEHEQPTTKGPQLESLPDIVQTLGAKAEEENINPVNIVDKIHTQMAEEDNFQQATTTYTPKVSISNTPDIEAKTSQVSAINVDPIIRSTIQEAVVTPIILVQEPTNEINETISDESQPEQAYLMEAESSSESDDQEVFMPSDDQQVLDITYETTSPETQKNTSISSEQPQPELVNEAANSDFTKIEAEVETADTITPIRTEQELVLDNFTQTLEIIMESAIVAPEEKVNQVSNSNKDSINEYTKETVESIPPIVRLIAEKIGAIEVSERKDIAPVVAEITNLAISLQSIDQQETENSPELEARLELLCIKLFEQLEIDLDEKNIRLFLQFINEEFVAYQTKYFLVDLEHDGTREAKFKLPALSHFVADEKHQLKQILGRLTLTYSQLLSAKPLYLS